MEIGQWCDNVMETHQLTEGQREKLEEYLIEFGIKNPELIEIYDSKGYPAWGYARRRQKPGIRYVKLGHSQVGAKRVKTIWAVLRVHQNE